MVEHWDAAWRWAARGVAAAYVIAYGLDVRTPYPRALLQAYLLPLGRLSLYLLVYVLAAIDVPLAALVWLLVMTVHTQFEGLRAVGGGGSP
jgi:hypothetical protein